MTRQTDFMHDPNICSLNWMYSPVSSKTHSQSNLINFWRVSEAMCPVAHERKSPVCKGPLIYKVAGGPGQLSLFQTFSS